MPFVDIRTSATPSDKIKHQLLRDLVEITSKHLGKSPDVTMAAVVAGEALFFRGKDDPSACLEIRSIGLPDAAGRDALCAELTSLVDEVLDIPPDRVFVIFRDIPRDQFGVNGKMLG
jgi:phenylpyruvate tautomerase PptA (4-oxalocrotonate tautomerase family)